MCRVTPRTFSKCIEFTDISYQLAQADTKTAIFENLCDLYNYLDASIHVQFSFINRKIDPKAKTKLHFDKVEKPAPKLKPNPASRPMEEAGLYLHGKIHEVEHENVGVEGGHKGEELAERQAGKAIRSGIRRHKLKPYRAAAKAEKKAIAANAEYIYQKSLRDNPEMAQAVKNPVARFWQKQKIKRDYAKAARAAGQTAQGAASATKTTAAAAKKAAEKSKQAASFVARHWKGVLLIGGVGLMLMLIMGGLQSCTAMFGSAGTGVAATSYLSEDSDMLGAEAAYADMEADLQYELDNYESLHPGYDEYRFDLDEIGHDPYVLTSILSALHEGVYTLGDVQGDLAMLFEKQYTLTQTIETETRYRTETRTDSEGNTYTVQVPYTYYICNVKLENFDMSHLPVYIMGEEQMSLYAVYMHTLGNRPDLFPNGTYPNASTVKEPTYYDIPPEALEDATFAAMMAEAEKYVGYPYVWGGSSPSTSFDYHTYTSNSEYGVDYTWTVPAKTGYYYVAYTITDYDNATSGSGVTTTALSNRTGHAWNFNFSDSVSGKSLPMPPANYAKGATTTRPSNLADTYYNTYTANTGVTLNRSLYDVHHIRPLAYGGSNAYSNLIHLPKATHTQVTSWWAGY